MIVTLFLISTNSYIALDAPDDRGVSYIEIWMIGTYLPILAALFQFGAITAIGKFFESDKDMKKWDLIAMVIVAIFHVIFQSVFWFKAHQFM